MTDEDFLRALSVELLLLRHRRQWDLVDVMKNDGPNYATVEKNERGDFGHVDSLIRHAKALDVSLVDIIRRVLEQEAGREPISTEALRVVRKFQSTTDEGRAALFALAQALPDAPAAQPEASRASPAPPRAAARPTTGETTRQSIAVPRRRATKRKR